MTQPVADPPSTILDYASPGLKKKLRLPSRSVLTFHVRENELVAVESVQAKAGAVAGVTFAGAILLWLAFLMLVSPRTREVLGFFWVAEFTVLVLVVHDTWRTTMLAVSAGGLDLRFATPFRRRLYRWAAADFRHAAADATDFVRHPPIGVLNLATEQSTLRLFDGQDHGQLVWLAAAIRQTLAPDSSVPRPMAVDPS